MAINPETGLEEVVHGKIDRGLAGTPLSFLNELPHEQWSGLLDAFVKLGGPSAFQDGSWKNNIGLLGAGAATDAPPPAQQQPLSFWDQANANAHGFQKTLNKMPGVFSFGQFDADSPTLTNDIATAMFQGNPWQKAIADKLAKDTAAQNPPATDAPAADVPVVGGPVAGGPGGLLGAGGPGDGGSPAGGDPATTNLPLLVAGGGSGGGLPRPPVGQPSRPGIHEPGGWQFDLGTMSWNWIPANP